MLKEKERDREWKTKRVKQGVWGDIDRESRGLDTFLYR